MAVTTLSSAVYVGHIRHRRYAPGAHAFRFPLFMMYLDLAELDRVFSGRWLWSIGRRNLAQFRRNDFLGDPDIPLDQAVRDCVQAQTGARPTGPIRLLAHLRYFGHCFNPVAFYYCFARDGSTLETIVAEITNTPWKERHTYVLPVQAAEQHGSALTWRFDKRFHVSPFLPMQRRYHWRFQVPGDDLRVHMDVEQPNLSRVDPEQADLEEARADFDATLLLRRQSLTGWTLTKALLRYPLMTLQVVLSIHWHAFFIWCKHNPVYDHPAIRKPP